MVAIALVAALGVGAGASGRGAETSLTFAPDADAYVTAASPKSNFGRDAELRADASPDTRSYLQFTVRGLPGPVASATLRVYTLEGASVVAAHAVSGSWSERSIKYVNAPAVSSDVAGSSQATQAGSWTSVDVTRLVAGNGTVGVALTSGSDLVRLGCRR